MAKLIKQQRIDNLVKRWEYISRFQGGKTAKSYRSKARTTETYFMRSLLKPSNGLEGA